MWAWLAVFLHESFALRGVAAPDRAAESMAFAALGAGAVGAWAGGWFADRYGRTAVTVAAMAASGAWTADDTYELRVCYTEGEVCPVLRFRFADRALTIEADPNVSWDDPTVVTVMGRAAEGGQASPSATSNSRRMT